MAATHVCAKSIVKSSVTKKCKNQGVYEGRVNFFIAKRGSLALKTKSYFAYNLTLNFLCLYPKLSSKVFAMFT